MFVLKNRHAPELSEANVMKKTQSFETVTGKYSSSDVSTILFTDVATKRLRVRSTCRHQSARHKWSRKHQFATRRSRSQDYWGLLL